MIQVCSNAIKKLKSTKMKRELMVGKEFDNWTVLNEIKTDKRGIYYECSCSCGEIKIRSGSEIRSRRSRMCRTCGYRKIYDTSREIGKKYGRWTILKYIGMNKKAQQYETMCDCGYLSSHDASELRSGKSKQCLTCHNREMSSNNIKHGMHNHPLYKVWSSMLNRCSREGASFYHQYGGRGIKVCERWKLFENFYKDMGDRPKGMTIDRINNDGNYELSNCRWVTHKENCQNRSNSRAKTSRP